MDKPKDRLYLDDLQIGKRFVSKTHSIDQAQIKPSVTSASVRPQCR